MGGQRPKLKIEGTYLEGFDVAYALGTHLRKSKSEIENGVNDMLSLSMNHCVTLTFDQLRVVELLSKLPYPAVTILRRLPSMFLLELRCGVVGEEYDLCAAKSLFDFASSTWLRMSHGHR